MSQTSLHLLRRYFYSCQVFEKGTFLCTHPIFFFHVVLSKLSSSPSTSDRHFTIYLQGEQFLSCHLPANNVEKHTGGNLCLCPQSQKCACTVMTQCSALPNSPVNSISQKWKPTCASPLRQCSFPKQHASERRCPQALPDLSPLPPAKAISSKRSVHTVQAL